MPGLDLLRAAAIAWVLIYHALVFDLIRPYPIVKFGWMGVDLFFALSGYLIAGQLFRPLSRGEDPDYGRFFMRRWLRTIPAYLFIVGVYFWVPVARDRDAILPAWRFLSFTQNIGLHPDPPQAFSHAWSLCVEEQFYLTLPLALVALRLARRPRTALAVLAALVVGGIAMRGWIWLHDVARTPFDIAAKPRSGAYMTLIYYPTWTRLDDLLAGISVAAIQAFKPAWWTALGRRCNLWLACGLAGVVASALLFKGEIGGFGAATFGYPLLACSMAMLVAGAAFPSSAAAALGLAPVRALAAGAYSLYLSHKIIYHWASWATTHLPDIPSAIWLLIAIAGALGLGAALYWSVERPFLRLRDRLGRRPMAVVRSVALTTD